jgi:hypothetical protein
MPLTVAGDTSPTGPPVLMGLVQTLHGFSLPINGGAD